MHELAKTSATPLVERVLREQFERWHSGERVSAEEFFHRYPGLLDHAEDTLDVVVAEFVLREELGEAPTLEEFLSRFPQFQEPLERHVELEHALERAVPTEADGYGPVERIVHAPSALAEPNGIRVPGYEIIGELGRGGMGVVYKAQHTTLHRTVALKLLANLSLARPEDVARFRIEGEALASLQHPHVVRLYEVGEWRYSEAMAIPFLAMEFVEGGSLDRVLNGQPQSPRVAAAFVEKLARATHAAHQRGIIHRDLKPANILLQESEIQSSKSERDHGPGVSDFGFRISDFTPKVSDFGLAKILHRDPHLTQTGTMLGTPSYIAPEQIEGSPAALTPACDVYALGAILFELLTGKPPFTAATPLRLLALVKSEEPVPPSSRRRIPFDLDTICLKCLRKDPRQRYASAEALADDLRRFLAGEPIRARPTPWWERGWKWARRRPAAAALIGVIGLALLSLAGGGLWYQKQLQAALMTAERERDRATAGYRLARQAVADYFTQVSESKLLGKESLQPLRKELLTAALKYYQEFLRQQGNDPTLRAELAQAYQRVAWITNAIGSKEDALAAYQKARDAFAELYHSAPCDPTYPFEWASCCDMIGRLQGETGQPADALRSHAQALAVWDALLKAQPAEPCWKTSWANSRMYSGFTYRQIGQLNEALRAHEEAQAMRAQLVQQQPGDLYFEGEYATGHINVGLVLELLDRPAEAVRSYEQARVLFEQLARRNSTEEAFLRSALAKSHSCLANAHAALGKSEEALRLHECAREHLEQLVQANPSVTDYQCELAMTCLALAKLERASGRWQAAQRAGQRANDLLNKLVQANPTVPSFQEKLATSYADLGRCRHQGEQPAAAVDHFEQAHRIGAKLVQDHPKEVEFQASLAATLQDLGRLCVDLRQPAQAQQAYTEAQGLCEELVRAQPGVPRYRCCLANVYYHLGLFHAAYHRPAEALRFHEQGRILLDQLIQTRPAVVAFQSYLAQSQVEVGNAHFAAGHLAEAISCYERARATAENILQAHPQRAEDLGTLGIAWGNRAVVLRRLGRSGEALEAFRQAVVHQRRAVGQAPQAVRYRRWLSNHYAGSAAALRDLHRPSDASDAIEERRQLWPHDVREQLVAAWEFVQCIPLVGQGKPELSPEDLGQQQRHAGRAVDAFRQALARIAHRILPVAEFVRIRALVRPNSHKFGYGAPCGLRNFDGAVLRSAESHVG